ncbi:MAG: PDZ domain-containing protein [Saprospiraceae bacterium]|nr:PDZ domain-containing protein [Saprospiraceae bacterium]
MKVTRPIFLSIMVALVFAVLAFLPRFDHAEKEAVLLRTIVDVIEAYHFDPLTIDDQFSEKVFDLYIDRIDRGRRWLTQEDMQALSTFKTKLDDEVRSGTFNFLDISVEYLEKGVSKTAAFYKEILAQPFDFSLTESVITEGSQKGFAADDKELKEYWRKNLKYEVMVRLANMIEDQEKLPAEQQETEAQLEEKARNKVLELYDGWYKRMAKLERHDRTTAYLNAITNVFDPHTGYYEPVQKQSFDIEFGGKLEGIGARLQEDDIYTKIVSIVVGGPAWKTKQIEEGDMIMKVTQADNDEGVDIKGMRVDDVVQLIRGKKGLKYG